jgi:hypothetical protein
MSKYIVISGFTDKDTGNRFLVGDVYESDDAKRADFLQDKGFLEEPSDAENENEKENEDDGQDIKHVGGGYYELPNGEKVRGKEAALEALNALDQDS